MSSFFGPAVKACFPSLNCVVLFFWGLNFRLTLLSFAKAVGNFAIPPVAYLFILWRRSLPIDFTELFLITNSPGVNIAGTVSLLPVPGTVPPLANLWILPPWFLPLPIPLARKPTPLPIANAPNKGIKGVTASTTLTIALAKSRAYLIMVWKPFELTRVRNSSWNSSLTLVSWLPKPCWALAASLAKLLPPC